MADFSAVGSVERGGIECVAAFSWASTFSSTFFSSTFCSACAESIGPVGLGDFALSADSAGFFFFAVFVLVVVIAADLESAGCRVSARGQAHARDPASPPLGELGVLVAIGRRGVGKRRDCVVVGAAVVRAVELKGIRRFARQSIARDQVWIHSFIFLGLVLEVDTGNLSCDFGRRCRVQDRLDISSGMVGLEGDGPIYEAHGFGGCGSHVSNCTRHGAPQKDLLFVRRRRHTAGSGDGLVRSGVGRKVT